MFLNDKSLQSLSYVLLCQILNILLQSISYIHCGFCPSFVFFLNIKNSISIFFSFVVEYELHQNTRLFNAYIMVFRMLW